MLRSPRRSPAQDATLPTAWAIAMLLLIAWAAEPAAHEIRPLIATVVLGEERSFTLEISLNLEAYLADVGPGHADTADSPNAARYDALRLLPAQALRARLDAVQADFIDAIHLDFDGRRPALTLGAVRIPAPGDAQLPRTSEIQLRGTLPRGAQTMTWRLEPRFGASVIRARLADAQEIFHSRYVAPGAASAVIVLEGLEPQSGWSVFVDYLVVGFEHIVPKGLDHILFVIGLFLLSPRLGSLLWQVSSFTVAHTVTLALAMAGVVQLPAAIVEPLIAASIVYVAVENLATSTLKPWRPLVVFAFGLLHGLGFAGVLADIGLVPGHFVTGLVGFNVGVELGQLAVIAGCFAVIGLWARNKPWYRKAITMPASAAVAAVGAWWFVQRIAWGTS